MIQPMEARITLAQVWSDYKAIRRLKPNTLRVYEQVIAKCLSDWLDLPVGSISKEMVLLRHKALSTNTAAQANLTMRVLKALITFATHRYEDAAGNPVIVRNPVYGLSEMRAWNRPVRRRGIIKRSQFAQWFTAVLSLPNRTVSDYLQFLVMTGMRKGEAAQLTWACVDLADASILIPGDKCKNGEDLEIPLSDYLLEMLNRRRLHSKGPWVFPGETPLGHLSLWNRTYQQIWRTTDIKFILHDLRRNT